MKPLLPFNHPTYLRRLVRELNHRPPGFTTMETAGFALPFLSMADCVSGARWDIRPMVGETRSPNPSPNALTVCSTMDGETTFARLATHENDYPPFWSVGRLPLDWQASYPHLRRQCLDLFSVGRVKSQCD